MCVFTSPKGALLAAVEIQLKLRTSDWIAGTERPKPAAAVHTGRVSSLAGAHLGSAAQRVTRLCSSATPGQILVSHSTQAMLEGELLDELELRDLGERELAGIEPTRVYELLAPSPS
jgi:class 3 adenylate cyclase